MKLSLCLAAAFAAALSASQAAPALALDADAVTRTDPQTLMLRWSGHDPVDVYVAERPDAPASQSRRIAHADRDGTLTLAWASARRPYFLLKDRRDGQMARTAERLLPLQDGSNFRDVGGYPAADGEHVRWGKIYRTAATPMLTDADFAYVRSLGIASDVDFRSTEERQIAPDALPQHAGARYFAKDYPASEVFAQLGGKPTPAEQEATILRLYRTWPVSLSAQYREVFKDLLRGDGAVTFHCSAGQDRTGVATALVLTALGVPRAVILADYQLSTEDRRPENEMPRIDAAAYPGNPVAAYYARGQAAGPHKPKPLYDSSGVPYLEQTFQAIEARWGSVDAYLDQELGVSKADIARLRALYLE